MAARLDAESVVADTETAMLRAPLVPSAKALPALRRTVLEQNRGFAPAEADDGLERGPPDEIIGKTGFFLAYNGQNDRDLQKAIADMYLRVWPSLGFQAPERPPAATEGGKIRLGILSMHLHGHTIGKINLGIIENLDREAFGPNVAVSKILR